MKKHVVIFLVFLALLFAFTFPLGLNFTTHIPGFFSTNEPYHFLWDSWRIKYSFANRLPLDSSNLIGFPFVSDIGSSFCTPILWNYIYTSLSKIVSGIVTYNLQITLNILLSALFMYLLVYFISESTYASVFSALVFAFCPYQSVRSWQHLGLTYNQWIPLVLFSGILVRKKPSLGRIVLFLLSALLLFSFDYQIAYFGLLIIMVFVLFGYISKSDTNNRIFELSNLRFIFLVFLSLLATFIILFPQFSFIFKYGNFMQGISAYRRPFEDLFAQSARPLSYFLPSAMHPVFGWLTERFIGTGLYGLSFTEHTLYLGLVPLFMAVLALKRRNNKKYFSFQEMFFIKYFLILAIVAWLFSQPPWWNLFGLKLYMPSYLMYKILPVYRAYCRFGIVVIFAVAALAGFGLKSITVNKGKIKKLFIICLASLAVLFEFWNWPPYKVIDVSRFPTAYYWLKDTPRDSVVAEYPLDADSSNIMYKFYQILHQKKIINSTLPDTAGNALAHKMTKLSNSSTIKLLKQYGVRYVVVHRDLYEITELSEMIDELKKITKVSQLTLVKSFPTESCRGEGDLCASKSGPIDIYELK